MGGCSLLKGQAERSEIGGASQRRRAAHANVGGWGCCVCEEAGKTRPLSKMASLQENRSHGSLDCIAEMHFIATHTHAHTRSCI